MTEEFRRRGLGYSFEPTGTEWRFLVDSLAHTSDDVRATVVADRRNGDGHWLRIHRSKMLMEGSNSKRDFAKQCQEMIDDEDKGKYWRLLVEDLATRVLECEEQGEPIRKVGRLNQPPEIIPLVEKLLPAFKPTVLYGPGGTGKGYVATGLAVAVQAGMPFLGLEVQQGNVLYLDWEDDEDELDLRIKEVSAGMGLIRPVEISRRGCGGRPLHSQVEYLARYVAEERIALVVIDSVEAAAGAATGSTYQDGAKVLFEALKKLGKATFLLIDHVSGESKLTKDRERKIFGSVFKENWARSTWEARKAQTPGEPSSHIALYHRKVNRGMLCEPIGISLDFSEKGKVILSKKDVTQSKELSAPLFGTDRILAAIIDNDGPMATMDLAEELKESDNKIRTWCGRLKDRNKLVKKDDGRWDIPTATRRATGEAYEIPF